MLFNSHGAPPPLLIAGLCAGDGVGARRDWLLLLGEPVVAVEVTEWKEWADWRDVNETGSTGSDNYTSEVREREELSGSGSLVTPLTQLGSLQKN